MTTTRPTAGVPTGAPADGLRSKEGAPMTTDRGEGFVRLPNWLIDEPGHLTNNEFLVYIVLLHRRNHRTGQCYPGFGEIAEKARLSRSTVKRVIPALERREIGRASCRERVYGLV